MWTWTGLFWGYILPTLVILAALYLVTAIVFLVTAKLDKDKDGNLYLDTDALHFKITHPFKRYDAWFMQYLEDGKTKLSLCGYFLDFFCALYFGWPFILFAQAMKLIFGSFILFLGGSYLCEPFSIEWMPSDHCRRGYDNGFFEPNKDFWMPKIKGIPIMPIWFSVPVLYGLALSYFYDITLHVTLIIVGIVVALIIVFLWAVGITLLLEKYKKAEDSSRTGLLRARLQARKQNVCPILKIKTASNITE